MAEWWHTNRSMFTSMLRVTVVVLRFFSSYDTMQWVAQEESHQHHLLDPPRRHQLCMNTEDSLAVNYLSAPYSVPHRILSRALFEWH
jgi:hypothetical protein